MSPLRERRKDKLTFEQKMEMFPSKVPKQTSATTSEAPSRSDYSQEEYEARLARWQSTVGRNRAIAERALQDFLQKSKSTDK